MIEFSKHATQITLLRELQSLYTGYRIDIHTIATSICINITFTKRILHKVILVTHNFKIEERRRKVATLLSQ